MPRYVVQAMIEDETGAQSVELVANCDSHEDADHIASLVEDAWVVEVGDEEWVNPRYREIAQEEERNG